MSFITLNKTKDTNGLNTTNLKRIKTMNQIKESEIKNNEILIEDKNKSLLFFNNENENNISKEVSPSHLIQNEKDYSKVNKNSDILNFL